MKRTKAEVIGAPFFQPHKLAHHFQDVDAGKNLLYGVLCDQVAKYSGVRWLKETSGQTGNLSKIMPGPAMINLRISPDKNLVFFTGKEF